MAKAPVMPVFTDALIGDTTHLSTEQFGAYVLILIATWRNNGKALPDDDERMAHVCRMGTKKWRLKVRPVLAEFFSVTDTGWHQPRLEKEWIRVERRLKHLAEQGRKGGLSKRPSIREANGGEPLTLPSSPLRYEEGPPDPPPGGHTAPRTNDRIERKRRQRHQTIARGLANWAAKHDIDCLAA